MKNLVENRRLVQNIGENERMHLQYIPDNLNLKENSKKYGLSTGSIYPINFQLKTYKMDISNSSSYHAKWTTCVRVKRDVLYLVL